MAASSNISRRRRSALSDGGAEYTAKREELVRTAARLFKERGYSKTRLIDIATEAGMDRATIYYYVGSKEELFRESIEGMLTANLTDAEAIVARHDIGSREKLSLIAEVLMVSYETHYPQMYVYIQEQMHQVAHEESAWAKAIMNKTRDFEKVVLALLKSGAENGEFRDDVPIRLVSNAFFGMFNWTHRWFTPNRPMSAREVANAFITIFFDGLDADARRRKPVRSPASRKA